MNLNGQIQASASLPPGSPITNCIGDGKGHIFCLNASGLKMEETGFSETTVHACEIIQCRKKKPYLNYVYPLDI